VVTFCIDSAGGVDWPWGLKIPVLVKYVILTAGWGKISDWMRSRKKAAPAVKQKIAYRTEALRPL